MWVFLDNKKNLVETCKQMKMNTDTYYRWLDRPLFRDYYDFMIALHTDAFEVIVWKVLMELVTEKKDIKAIRTYFEVKDKLKTHQTKISNTDVNYNFRFGKPAERVPGQLSR